MELIPAIDLRAGRCVRLFQGDYAKETVFSDDPPGMARHWRDHGATRLHVVDLDGAAAGRVLNTFAIQAIVAAVDIPVELGGGIRDIETVNMVLGWGVDRVILGTAAVRDPEFVERVCSLFPGRIVAGIDASDGRVAINGWLEATTVDAGELAGQMVQRGVPRFIYTDISRDGTVTEPNFEGLAQILRAGRPVIASGGVGRIEHLVRLREAGAEGAIVGQALYTGAITVGAALAALAEPPRHEVEDSHAAHKN
ncbi:MAG: 1-(5-phosphoribosyl)-5-[(5-phosphoribosylamino)methylideneamino]imidazole-4-carboxamide isomerase [Dehalococcoidia bacterium]|nr:1-(5-phosphoribosyl)-5-[(5-phosphoribosylamino)methylideneamino]imidazole-4-carboxamide isomerase [Dehalococcoidia bacterium]